MGIGYSLFLDYFERRGITEDNSVNQQTEPKNSTGGSLEASSTEELEYKCDVCDSDYQREADCFCKECGQYLCKTCSKIHTKISSTKNHNVLGKTAFSALNKANELSGLFKMKLAPLKRIHDPSGDSTSFEIIGLHQLPGLGKTCVLLYGGYSEIEVGYLHATKGYSKVQSIATDEIPCHDLDDLCDFIYFIIPEEKHVYIYNADNETVEKTFSTRNLYYSITRFDFGLAALIKLRNNRWKIQFLTYEGILKEGVCFNQNGQHFFKNPQQLASNHSETVLYVSGNKTVIALDTSGNVLFKIMDEMLSSAQGLTSDTDGNIYVACSTKIVQIEKNGQKCKKLQTTETGISFICYNYRSKKMFISDHEDVTIYQCLQ